LKVFFKKQFKSLFNHRTPEGLEDVSKYPNLVVALLENGWSKEDIIKLIGGNLVRVFEEVEKVFYFNKKTCQKV
jgi:microsomal dipeptidase-like Zn-dependent dipeptidase